MTETLGVGIIGCGNISTTYLSLAPLFRGIDIRAVADMNMAAAKARAEEYGVVAQSVEDLLGNPEIDIVVNLTIPDAHVPVSKSILEAGKHVFSEKPLSLSVEDGLALRDLADAKGLKVGCTPDTFLGGSHQLARKLIDDGAIGQVAAGTAHVMSHGMEHWHPNPDFFFQPGGGPMLDIGPYYIAELIHLIGPVRRVAALASAASETRTILTEGPRTGEKIEVTTPTNIHALLEFQSGATITLSTSWDVWSHRHGNMELYGEDGSLFLPDPNFFGGALERVGRDGVAAEESWAHPFSKPNQTHGDTQRANYRTAGLADLALSILQDREARCSLDRALHGVDVMTAALRSGESGRFIEMQTTCTRPEPLGPEEARALLA